LSATIRIDASGFLRELSKLEADTRALAHQALDQAAAHTAFLARNTNLFKDRTGAARSSVTRGQSGEWAFYVRAGGRGAKHVLFLEEGTKPHVIAARRRKFLRFTVDGVVYFRRKVQHPGTKPRPFMREAADYAEHTLIRFLDDGFSRLLT